MSPEQAARRGRPSPRSDVFAFGAVLYEMLTGRRAFAGATPLETRRRHLWTTSRRRSPAGAPPAALRARSCAAAWPSDPEERFASARELLAALDALVAADDAAARRAGRARGRVGVPRRAALRRPHRRAGPGVLLRRHRRGADRLRWRACAACGWPRGPPPSPSRGRRGRAPDRRRAAGADGARGQRAQGGRAAAHHRPGSPPPTASALVGALRPRLDRRLRHPGGHRRGDSARAARHPDPRRAAGAEAATPPTSGLRVVPARQGADAALPRRSAGARDVPRAVELDPAFALA